MLDSDVCCFSTLGGKYQVSFRSRERISCYISQPKTGGISKLESFGANFQPLKLHLCFLVTLAQFFTKIQHQRGQPLASLMWPKIIYKQLVWSGSYSCSVGSRGCGRARGTELIEPVTVAIRLISHIGSPSVRPGGPTVWQKGRRSGSAGQHLLLLNTSCHSSPPYCCRTGCSEASILWFHQVLLLERT